MVERFETLFGTMPKTQPASLKSVVYSIIDSLRVTFPMAEILLEVNVSDSDRLICMSTLETVLRETIENAYEISRKPVTVLISDVDDGFSIRIIDEGKAFSEEACTMAFEPFYTTRTRHLGVGLSIAKRMVAGQGGTVALGTETTGNFVEIILPFTGN